MSELTPVSYHFTKDVSNPVRICPACNSTFRRLPCLMGQGVALMMDLCPVCDKEATRRTLEEMNLRLIDEEEMPVDAEEFLMDDPQDGTIPLSIKNICIGLLVLFGFWLCCWVVDRGTTWISKVLWH